MQMDLPIGNTPLIPLQETPARILGKLETLNLTGSAKDRPAAAMLEDIPGPEWSVAEATSGNMGIALAALCARRGIPCRIFMPADASRERMQLIRFFGAEVTLTPASAGMAGACRSAEEWCLDDPKRFYVNQFRNPSNSSAHYRTTGPEIWTQTQGRIHVFLAGVGTGGTVTGAGRFLKEQDPSIEIFAVAPAPGAAIPGIGAGFPPPLLARDLLSGWLEVSEQDASAGARELARTHGILVGPSAGAAYRAAMTLARRPDYQGKTLVAILPDTGHRYLSTGLFDPK
ncbi:MAG: cysteine synthase family protein [Ruminococcaceae bacterium]|nr:cysteine synthase family protein [Oscillospiraceae bacterium]